MVQHSTMASCLGIFFFIVRLHRVKPTELCWPTFCVFHSTVFQFIHEDDEYEPYVVEQLRARNIKGIKDYGRVR